MDLGAWVDLRAQLWPDTSRNVHHDEAQAILATTPTQSVAFLDFDSGARGFVEASLRHDHVNGCDTSPVAFVEGIYVRLDLQGSGIGRALLEAVKSWAQERGCSELASDAHLENVASHAFHTALGFDETERVVFFRKQL